MYLQTSVKYLFIWTLVDAKCIATQFITKNIYHPVEEETRVFAFSFKSIYWAGLIEDPLKVQYATFLRAVNKIKRVLDTETVVCRS